MRDWRAYVRERLHLPALSPEREAEVIEELALQLEDVARHAIAMGASDEEACAIAEQHVPDWTHLARDIAQEDLKHATPPDRRLSDRLHNLPGPRWLEPLLQDLQHTARSLAKVPGFTFFAVLTFAVGIGLVTIQFSFVSGVLLRGLPFERSDRIMAIGQRDQYGRKASALMADFSQWRTQQRSFSELAAYKRGMPMTISGERLDARTYHGATLGADVLKTLRVHPILGRGFTEDDEQRSAPPVLLVSHHLWRSDFGADPDIIGRSVRLGGEPATIVGVMPEGFAFPNYAAVWRNQRFWADGRDRLDVIGRLRPDATMAAAHAEFEVLMRQRVDAGDTATTGMRPHIRPLWDTMRDDELGIVLLLMLGATLAVAALACVNVANMLAVRAVQRAPELAVRSALGANRGRLVRQMLTESGVLAVAGAVGGALLSVWLVPVVNHGLASGERPFWRVVELDGRGLAATAVLTAVVGVLAGLFPALRATRSSASEVLKNATARGATPLGRLNRFVVIAQVSLSCAVLLITSIMIDAVRKSAEMPLPFAPERMLSAELSFDAPAFDTEPARVTFRTALLERVRALPGVEHATITGAFPFAREGGAPLEVEDASGNKGVPWRFINPVAPGFFRDLRVPLREGREFTEADTPLSAPVAIVSESFARLLWPNASALGKRVRRHHSSDAPAGPWMTVVGVVADLPLDSPERRQGLHVPLGQIPSLRCTLFLTTSQDPLTLIRPLRERVRALSPDVPVDSPATLAAQLDEHVRLLRLLGGLSGAFGASAVLLAAIGVFGVTSFAVARRTREFGLRLAVGAQPKDLLALVFHQGARQLALGLLAGLFLGWAASRPLALLLTQIATPPGLEVYLVIFVGIAAPLGLALWLPGRRAASVDPIVTLRTE